MEAYPKDPGHPETHPNIPTQDLRYEASNNLKLRRQFRHDLLWNGDRAVLLPLAMNSEYPGIEVEILHP